MPFCKRDPIQKWAIQIQHALGVFTGFGAAHVGELTAQNAIRTIGENDDGHIKIFACHGPEGLHGIHRTTVTDKRKHLAIWAGDCGADRGRQAPADRAACDVNAIVWRRLG